MPGVNCAQGIQGFLKAQADRASEHRDWFDCGSGRHLGVDLDAGVIELLAALRPHWRRTSLGLTQESATHRPKDSKTIEYEVTLQPDEERTLTYTAHYTW
jgi:hypothetical protein